MKKFIRSVSILLALTLVVTAFAACGKQDESPTTTEPITVNGNTANASNTQRAEVTDGKNNTSDHNNDSKSAVKKPSTSAELIAAYNSAITTKKLSCASVRQKVASGTVGTKDNVVIDFSEPKYTEVESDIAFRETFERNDKNGMSLTALSSSDVESVSVKGNTVTIKLKSYSASESVSGGTHGYLNVVDTARVAEIGTAVKNAVPDAPGNVKLKTASLSFSNGVITAEFSDDFTQLKSVKFSCTETINASFSYLVLTVIADLKYNITSEYK